MTRSGRRFRVTGRKLETSDAEITMSANNPHHALRSVFAAGLAVATLTLGSGGDLLA